MRGALMMIGAVSIFACMDTIAKYLTLTYPVAAIVWARYTFQMLFMLAVLAPRLGFDLLRSRRPGLQIVRGVVLTLSSLVFFTALSVMPIAEASAITFTSPLLVMAFSVAFMRERVDRRGWIAVGASFAGVLIIIRPGADIFSWAAILPLATAVCFAAYQLLTRKLAGVDRTLTTLFYPAAAGTVMLSLALPLFWTEPASPWHAALFMITGIVGGVGHFILIRAFEHAPASFIAPLQYMQLVTVIILGYLVFGEFPDAWSLLGMAIIVTCGLFIAARHRGLARR
jgi:drug/metabolite transporter (DMT)-like permease